MLFRLNPLALAVLGLSILPVSHTARAETVLGAQTVTAKGYAADTLDTPQAVEILQAPAGKMLNRRPILAVQLARVHDIQQERRMGHDHPPCCHYRVING